MNGPFSIRFPVLGGAYFLAGRAATEVKRRLGETDLPHELARRIIIATYEAETNICIHARTGEIVIEVAEEGARVQAEDQGPGIPDLEQAFSPGFTTAPPEARAMGFGAGMGFPNMKQCADEMQVETEVGKGTCVKMRFVRRVEESKSRGVEESRSRNG